MRPTYISHIYLKIFLHIFEALSTQVGVYEFKFFLFKTFVAEILLIYFCYVLIEVVFVKKNKLLTYIYLNMKNKLHVKFIL